MLIAIEGLDQSGKATQAELLRDRLRAGGTRARMISFPDYGTSIGEEIARALQGERNYGPEAMQLLHVANRYERKDDLERWLNGGLAVVCDRYVASGIAYGVSQGLDARWLTDMQRFLPVPDLTLLIDIDPALAVDRKPAGRDSYERDLALLQRVRDSYLQQGEQPGWVRVDGDRPKQEIADEIITIVGARLAPA